MRLQWSVAFGCCALITSCTTPLSGHRHKVHQAIDSLISKRLESQDFPGATVIVLQGDDVVYEGYHGLANVELGVPVSEHSVFAIASMTKAFTAAAILLLEQDGLLRLDDPVSKHLPEAPTDWSRITIRSLLDHTSGLPDDWGLHDDWGAEQQFFLTTTSASQFLQSLAKEPLAFEAGSQWRYSCGPFVAGLVIERVTGIAYADVLEQRIFQPLGMTSTRIGDPNHVTPFQVTGYLGRGKDLRHGHRISAAAHARADVGIISSGLDMMRWINAIRDGSLLGRDGTSRMFSTAVLGDGTPTPAGLGWFVVPIHGTKIIEHSGLFRTGFSSSICWYPSEDLSAIVLTNQGDGASLFELAQSLLGCIDKRLAPISTMGRRQDMDPQRLGGLSSAMRAAGTGEPDPHLSSFPYLFHGPSTRRLFASTAAIEPIDHEVLAAGSMTLFGREVRELLYCKAIANREYFTTLYLDEEGRILFLDWPE